MKNPNFIEIYDDVLDLDHCKGLIQAYKNAEELGLITHRRETNPSSLNAQDKAIFIPGDDYPLDHCSKNLANGFIAKFWEKVYTPYSKKYQTVEMLSSHSMYILKLQKTAPGEGYHVWHFESSSLLNTRRVMAFIVYLNDVEEGGETEFLYQNVRVKPKAGRAVLWPAYFTHPHRGNPPLKNEKYIVTGWIELG